MNKALIIKIISSEYTILLEDKSIQKAILAGKMRLDRHPVVGDYVEYITSDNKYVIQNILERRNYLIRPNLANIDNAIIMMSTKDPSFSYELVNRLIMLIEYADIRPIICISKADLGDNQEIEEIKTYYETMNYDVIISDISNDFRNLEGILENKITVLCGQSGVGKSSLLNKLQPELNLKTNEIIEDEGVYKYYADYQPTCWIWNEYQLTHGKQNVTLALENSCNFFFYEVGRRMGIDTLGKYANKFGLGEKTGIELGEETAGHMASPEYKKQVVSNVTSQDWYGGDTLQAAIGQSYSLFTPLQLANYAATIANGGTRYKVNLVKSVRSSVDGSVVKEFSPEVVERVDMDADVLNAVKQGMKKVVDEGSAAEVFANYGIQVGGKTGTAQVGDGSNNAVFIAYAPFDDPQIAVSVVLEHGVRGTNAAQVAKDIFDKYFNLAAAPQDTAAPTAAPAQTDNGLLR